MRPEGTQIPPTTRLWTTTVEVTFQADDIGKASALALAIAGRCLDIEEVWNVEGHFNQEQKTETVDAPETRRADA